MTKKRQAKAKMGRPLLGKQAKQRHTVMIEPEVAAMLKQLGGENLSRGIALAAAALRK
jgi:hypothetical protein